MSQANVERVVGRLATDEGFRRRFAEDAQAAIAELVGAGLRLSECEQRALAALDPAEVSRFAESIDPRLQKCELRGCADAPPESPAGLAGHGPDGAEGA